MNTTRTPAARSMARVAAKYAADKGVSIEEAVMSCVRAALNSPTESLPQFVRDYLAENPNLGRVA